MTAQPLLSGKYPETMKKKSSLILRAILVACAFEGLVAPSDTRAGLIPNGSFEDVDDLDTWTTVGNAATVGVRGTAAPTDGITQMFLQNTANFTATSVASFLGLPTFPTDNGLVATQASAVQQTFTTLISGTLSFDYMFVTNEAIGSARDQTAFYLNGVITLLSNPRSAGVASGTGVSGYPNGLPYQTITLAIAAGTHTLGFLVYDTSPTTGIPHTTVNTGLFIDNVSVSAPQAAPVPEPSSFGIVGALLLAVGMVSNRRRGRPARA